MSDIKRVTATVKHLVIYPNEGHQVDWESIRDQCLNTEKKIESKDKEIKILREALESIRCWYKLHQRDDGEVAYETSNNALAEIDKMKGE